MITRILCAASFAAWFILRSAAAEQPLVIEGDKVGRVFEGIGGVSAGASSRLLIDYEDPYRSDILDFLFKPNFGIGFQHFKVEMGGGGNSTCGSEPSHAMVREECVKPVARGYEFWLMTEARRRNSQMILEYLPWCLPSWLSARFSPDTADYFVAFLQLAKKQYGLDIDYVAAGQNEMGTDMNWIVENLRPAMDRAGFKNVKIQAPDDNSSGWKIFDDFEANPKYAGTVDAVGYHYIDNPERNPTPKAQKSGKPIWSSEDWWSTGEDWEHGRIIVERMNRYYIDFKVTKFMIWAPIDSMGEGINQCEIGVMKADTPWSGAYTVRPAVWGVAHYTQFAEPGWRFIDSGCGHLHGKANYTTLRHPKTGDYSVIICTEENSETLSFKPSGGLASGPLHVWKSDARDYFVQQKELQPSQGVFTITCDPRSVYSLTTTSGQQKGQPPHPIPPQREFALPYFENYEKYPVGVMAKYHSDMRGSFEVAKCKGRRSGNCLEQRVPQSGYLWGEFENNVLMVIPPGQQSWSDYEVSVDVFVEQGNVFLAARKGTLQWWPGYTLVLDRQGNWQMVFDYGRQQVKAPDTIFVEADLAARTDFSVAEKAGYVFGAGKVQSFDPEVWHSLRMRYYGETVEASIDNVSVLRFKDTERLSGHVSFGGSYAHNQFDNLAIAEVGNSRSWITVDDQDKAVEYSPGWADFRQQYYMDGTCKYTDKKDLQASLSFEGTRIRFYGARRGDLGKMHIFLDGKKMRTVDAYSVGAEFQSVLFDSEEIEPGRHTIQVVTAGEKTEKSSGTTVIIDGFKYLPVLK